MYPDQAAQMRTTLIATLEREERNLEEIRKKNQNFDESYSEHYANLIWAVGWLQDPRAVRGLLGALHTGGTAQDGLADLGPFAVDVLLERVRGQDPSERPFALRVLGDVLLRESTRLDSEAVGKIRRAVAAALEDRDPALRASAASASLVFRDEADIRERLESLAAFDPYSDLKGIAGSRDFPEYPVRAAAARILTSTEEKLYYVSRTAEGRTCRVQSGAEPPAGARFLGPFYSPAEATRWMCRHMDGWKENPTKCWTTSPKTNCGWPGDEDRETAK